MSAESSVNQSAGPRADRPVRAQDGTAIVTTSRPSRSNPLCSWCQEEEGAASPPLCFLVRAAHATGPFLRSQGCLRIALRATACGRPLAPEPRVRGPGRADGAGVHVRAGPHPRTGGVRAAAVRRPPACPQPGRADRQRRPHPVPGDRPGDGEAVAGLPAQAAAPGQGHRVRRRRDRQAVVAGDLQGGVRGRHQGRRRKTFAVPICAVCGRFIAASAVADGSWGSPLILTSQLSQRSCPPRPRWPGERPPRGRPPGRSRPGSSRWPPTGRAQAQLVWHPPRHALVLKTAVKGRAVIESMRLAGQRTPEVACISPDIERRQSH